MKKKIGKALVVGAGIGGLRSALDLAQTGYQVHLIEREEHLGGFLARLDYQFPTNRCGMCRLLPAAERDASSQYCLRKGMFHENIEVLLGTELIGIEGEAGRFEATLKTRSRLIDPELCNGCGECARACPVEVPDLFNAGLGVRKAVYLPSPYAIPNPFVIDIDNCTKCGACAEACPTGAVNLVDRDRLSFRILVVDDELIVRDSLKEWLSEEGFGVDMAGSGTEALDRLSEEKFDLMLLDIKMTGMDGVEVLRRAKDLHPELTVIMMTAYATVDTAVDAMKIGALDYLIKPFEPEAMIPMVEKVYQDVRRPGQKKIEVGAVVLNCGVSLFDPRSGPNPYGYGVYPDVVTSLEFERIISNAGPGREGLTRPGEGPPVKKIAWLQCVGSRDLQKQADYCSSFCCMAALKEAMLVKEKYGPDIETKIFYMDFRTFGQEFQRVRDKAEELGIRLVRARVHSAVPGEQGGGVKLSYVEHGGSVQDEVFDLVVLSVGARPAHGSDELAGMLSLDRDEWGYIRSDASSLTRTDREGIMLGGSAAGMKDIQDSVIQASAAALDASRTIHSNGGGLAPVEPDHPAFRDVSREPARILEILCTCDGAVCGGRSPEETAALWKTGARDVETVFVPRLCTAQGRELMVQAGEKVRANRVLIGACLPFVYSGASRELGERLGLDPALIHVFDLRTAFFQPVDNWLETLRSLTAVGRSMVRRADLDPVPEIPVTQRALVVGGGIAGMTAALALADHGFQTDMVEKEDQLGGNLLWLDHTLEGHSLKKLLAETLDKVEKHSLIQIRTSASLMNLTGDVGAFQAVIRDKEGALDTSEYGVVILALGGGEAVPSSYGYGRNKGIVTQKELELRLTGEPDAPETWENVVMIQCVESRMEPRNYCSRVCCPSALKNALAIKEKNPSARIYVFYRDMMTPGFIESSYTEARKKGIVFIPYTLDRPPQVDPEPDKPLVTAWEPMVGREVAIEADQVVLASGIQSSFTAELAETCGIDLDEDGFFLEADSKWRPTESLTRTGIFSCGLALSPRSAPEAVASAEAAAMRALELLSRESLSAGRVVARVRESLCSLCEKCLDACPYQARSLDPDLMKIRVNPVMCQGCGACAAVCPNGAAIVSGYRDERMFETIDAALESVWAG